jgi:hypothetical protein
VTTAGPGSSPDESVDPIDSMGGCFLHLFAQVAGYMLLGVLALLILLRPPWRVSWVDALYALTALAVPVAQRLDATRARPAAPESTAVTARGGLSVRIAGHLAVAAAIWAFVNWLHVP